MTDVSQDAVAPRISLALAIHNHQPVGNFGWVIAEVYERAYEPLLGALERHPTVRVALHYSGPLLAWMESDQPESIKRLRALVGRGQVEMLGGGLYEPILASLPESDRVGQLVRMRDEVARLFGSPPNGAWLAERVWEPSLPTSLAAAGYGWTILDDTHFQAGAVADDAMWGAYVTEDQGSQITVFGTEQGLRYRIPFGEVDDVIAHLRKHSTDDGRRVGVMGDDGEKFGAWPSTWDRCWGSEAWIERFFVALEANVDWLTTVTPSDWLAREAPIGRIYVPTSSYAEMGEWSLPAEEAPLFARAIHDAIDAGRPEAAWLRGGFWRSFQVRYREINDLHKQMLRASAAVRAMPDGPARDRALDHLYRGQSNDCYWHGLFGGIYISHMRLATHEHLIAAEDLADAALGTSRSATLRDLDADGIDEALLAESGQVVAVDLAEGAGIGAWDIRAARHALTSVMRRRPEAYHATLLDADEGSAVIEGEAAAAAEAADTAVSIHDLRRAKEQGLAADLHYDAFERRSGLVRILPLDTAPRGWRDGTAPERGDFVDRPYEVVEIRPGRLVVGRDGSIAGGSGATAARVEKTIELTRGRMDPGLALTVTVANTSDATVEALVGVEWNLMFLGGGANPAAWYEVLGRRSPHDGSGALDGATSIRQGNDQVGLTLETTVADPAALWWAPIETISNSEGGIERVYQGSASIFAWPIRLEPGARWTARVEQHVEVERDRAEV